MIPFQRINSICVVVRGEGAVGCAYPIQLQLPTYIIPQPVKSEKRGEENAKLMEGGMQLPTIMEPYIIPHHRIYIYVCVSTA